MRLGLHDAAASIQQVDIEVPRGLISELAALAQRLAHDRFDILRNVVVVAGNRIRLVIQDVIGDLGHRGAVER